MHRGWIKAWRKEYDSPIWDMPPLYLKVWWWILYRCDYKTGTWDGAISQIADGCQWVENNKTCIPARSTILYILNWMDKHQMILYRPLYRQKVSLSIVNWGTYQGPDEGALNRAEVQAENSNKTSTRSKKKLEEEKPKDMPADAGNGRPSKDEISSLVGRAEALGFEKIWGMMKKWTNEYGYDMVAEALTDLDMRGWTTETEPASGKHNPIGYITTVLAGRRKGIKEAVESKGRICPTCRVEMQDRCYTTPGTVADHLLRKPIWECPKCKNKVLASPHSEKA